MEKGRHVMACKKSFPFSFPICRGKLQKVLDTYNGYTKRLKKAYTAKLKKRSASRASATSTRIGRKTASTASS